MVTRTNIISIETFSGFDSLASTVSRCPLRIAQLCNDQPRLPKSVPSSSVAIALALMPQKAAQVL